MSKYNLDVMDGERLLMDGRGRRLPQECDKNAQRRKRDRIPQEGTYMPDDIRRNKHRKMKAELNSGTINAERLLLDGRGMRLSQ